MIELWENLLEIVVISLCFAVSLRRTVRERKKGWAILTLFYAGYLLGDLYWTLYLFFYQRTPSVFYVSELSWCAAYLFLILLLHHYQSNEERALRSPVLWIIPLFVFGMMIFYFRWGDYLLNAVDAVLMGMLMLRSVQGLLAVRGTDDARKMLFAVSLFFCLAEYFLWTSSCFFRTDSWGSPYFWFSIVLVLVMPIFFIAVRKAEAR